MYIKYPHGRHSLLSVEPDDRGLVLLVHDSDSDHLDDQTSTVASALQGRQVATFQFDQLTQSEAADMANLYDFPLMVARIEQAVTWCRQIPSTASLNIGIFGMNIGGSAALAAAANMPRDILAVVSFDGWLEIDPEIVKKIEAPVLLVVSTKNKQVIERNVRIFNNLNCRKGIIFLECQEIKYDNINKESDLCNIIPFWFNLHL